MAHVYTEGEFGRTMITGKQKSVPGTVKEVLRILDRGREVTLQVPIRKSECTGDVPFWNLIVNKRTNTRVFIDENGKAKIERLTDDAFRYYVEITRLTEMNASELTDAFENNSKYGIDD